MADAPQQTTLPPGWLARVVNLLNAMAGEGIGMADCDDPADLMVEIANHLGFGDHDDPWASVTVQLNEDAANV